MKMVEYKASIDNLIWRFHKRLPPHDIKINIRNGSIFEGLQIKITVLYFLLYFCFIENMSINESVSKCNGFCVQVGETNTTAQSVSKFYAQVRSRLRQKMHKSWESELIGVEINERLGYSSIEIDESKIISHTNEIFWMFSCIDRIPKKKELDVY